MCLPSLAAARQFGTRLAAMLRPGDIIQLEGDLGAGKTELARAIIRARAGRAVEVPSPTFTLVQRYEMADLVILHADLYRIADASEIEELGLLDEPDAVLLIEWWQRGAACLPPPGLIVTLRQGHEDDMREVTLDCLTASWRERLR